MAGLLEGFRIVEVAVLLSGDTAGGWLADEGADHIKVEMPGVGDYLRDFLGQVAPRYSPAHLYVNRNKRSLAVDLRTPEGREVVHDLVRTADVFLTGNIAGTLEKLGIDYATLSRIRSGLVFCQVTGYGAEGPYATVPTHGQMMNGLAGGYALRMRADGLVEEYQEERRPLGGMTSGPGVVIGPVFAAYAVAAALARRGRTGEGACIDISCADAVLTGAWHGAHHIFNAGRIAPVGIPNSGKGGAVKYQFYETKDGKFMLFCAIERKFWNHWCDVVERPDLKEQHENELPVDWTTEAALRLEVQKVFHSRTQAEWMALFAAHDIAAGPAAQPEEVQYDPHLLARGMILDTVHPVAGDFRTIGNPIRVQGEQFAVRHPAPAVGQHNDEILSELGYSAERIDALRAGGIL